MIFDSICFLTLWWITELRSKSEDGLVFGKSWALEYVRFLKLGSESTGYVAAENLNLWRADLVARRNRSRTIRRPGSPVTSWWKVLHIRIFSIFSPSLSALMTFVAVIDSSLTFLPDDEQGRERLVGIELVVLPGSRPRRGKNLWLYGCLIWLCDFSWKILAQLFT